MYENILVIYKEKTISNLIEFESSYCIENFEGKLKKIKENKRKKI